MSFKFDQLADFAGTLTLSLVLMAQRARAGHPQCCILSAGVLSVIRSLPSVTSPTGRLSMA